MIDKLPKICSYVCYSHNYTSSGQKWNHANGACGFAWRHACLMCLSLRVFFAWIFSGFDMKLTLVREACMELLIWSFILSVHQDNWAVHGNIRARLSLSRFLHLEFFCDKIKLAALVTILRWYLPEFILCGNAADHLSRSDFTALITNSASQYSWESQILQRFNVISYHAILKEN